MTKVLVVEDSMLIANAIKIILAKENIQTVATSDGNAVVDMLKKDKYALVILDLMMPKVSGEEVFKQIKTDYACNNIKIMILTAKADALKWNPDLGIVDSFMTKPFDNAKLVSEIKRLIG